MYPPILRVHLKKRSARDLSNKSICYGYPFELHLLGINAIQMGTHKGYNICLDNEVDTGCNLKTSESLGCALIEVCTLIKLSTVCDLLYMSHIVGFLLYLP